MSRPSFSGYSNVGFPKVKGTFCWGVPNNKDYSLLGSILESPYFGKLPCCPKLHPHPNREPERLQAGVPAKLG